jgi:hypothetical protein
MPGILAYVAVREWLYFMRMKFGRMRRMRRIRKAADHSGPG